MIVWQILSHFFSVKPRRLAKRYFKNNPLFALKILGQLSGLKKYPME
jgi:hypothetical protein